MSSLDDVLVYSRGIVLENINAFEGVDHESHQPPVRSPTASWTETTIQKHHRPRNRSVAADLESYNSYNCALDSQWHTLMASIEHNKPVVARPD